MNRIDSGLPNIALGSQPQAGNGQAQSQVGTLLGEAAVLVDGEFSLADGAEELSLHMAEKTEDKHHAERKIKPDKPMELMQPAAILETLDQTHDPDAQEKLHELYKKLISGDDSPRRAAGNAFQDVSQQFLALQYALQKGEQDGAGAHVLEGIRDALAELEMERGPEIRAGLNSLKTAGQFANDAAGVASFQHTYRDIVLGENSLAKTLNLALERFGDGEVGAGLRQLIAALGHDLAAARPSIGTNRLQSLIQDMYQLEVAVTVLDGCRELGEKLATEFRTPLDASKLMRDLVSVSHEKWVAASRFTGMATSHGVCQVEAEIAFLTGVRGMLKEMPVQVFSDADNRQSILTAAQEALDTAIDKEYE